MRPVLVDTGPLVAILSQDDDHHEVCVRALHEMRTPLLSCWPVITEATWLLRKFPGAVQKLVSSLDGGFVELLPLGGSDATQIATLMRKYEDIRPQLADAAIVYLSRHERIKTIFTLDQRDFSIYRGSRKRLFEIVPELG